MIKLTLANSNQETGGKLLRAAVPFAQGAEADAACLHILQNGSRLVTEATVTARWPDNSIRWVAITAYALTPLQSTDVLILNISESPRQAASAWQVNETAETISLKQADVLCTLTKNQAEFQTGSVANPEQAAWATNITLYDQNNVTQPWLVDNFTREEQAHSAFPKLQISGCLANFTKIRFNLTLQFFPEGLVALNFSLHNTGRAYHPNGLWDLGDKGSFLFNALAINIAGKALHWQLQAEQATATLQSNSEAISLAQHSSGGENWDSRNHINATGQMPLTERGYSINNTLQQPPYLRAEPVAQISNAISTRIAVPYFWQKFPQAIKLTEKGLTLELFAQQQGQCHELQGGEKSTREVWLQFNSNPQQNHSNTDFYHQLAWVYQPNVATVSAEYIANCQVMPWFSAEQHDELAKLLISPAEFIAKREIIDEYGWRNFGDIFADHETLYQSKDETPYISHYNNQYDAIYGFCRQFLLTGNARWFSLMDELAKHVTDIDIYDTDDDRDEYNHGLFWHTDHYLPAETATHRTYSRFNKLNGRHTAGGGPGPEHCYTTGLAYHYWLTGCEASKQAVLKLTEWITLYHEGSECFLGKLLAIKTNDIPRLIRLLKGEKVLPHTYAFTRGTGNYITALLDSYLLTNNRKYLVQAEGIIKQVVHPNDDIAARDLLNVEVAWSYLICLSSIMRYINIKAMVQEYDQAYSYAIASVMHYARWISKYEQPFLAEPTKLDYPNSTWTAQDIRKAMLLYQASSLTHDDREAKELKQEAKNFFYNTIAELKCDESLHFSRIQIILLQNHGPHLKHQKIESIHISENFFNKPASISLFKQLKDTSVKLILGLAKINLKKEWVWLAKRFNHE